MLLLNIENPVHNTIIVFSIIMILLYLTKPEVLYDNEKKEFRQFGTTDGKTLLPIYVVGILLAIILYVFFHYLSLRYKDSKPTNSPTKSYEKIIVHDHHEEGYGSKKEDEYRYLMQQQQIHQLQNQLNQFMQQQLITQRLIQPTQQTSRQLSIDNTDNTNNTISIKKRTNNDNYDFGSILPNNLSV